MNKQITANKIKHLEVQEKLNSLIAKYCIFFLGRIYFTNNDESQNTFAFQPTLERLGLKKDEGNDFSLVWKSKGVYNSKLNPLYTALLHKNFSI